ncbi:hypothetical protein WR25_14691 [Diploscapter pachys]|uniref:C2H2-type domain-containing protein n=1 Tax=Diploscapter pachys TaxID=2018661 RepID=A0A2A2KNF0_9BILA|nr:hypothetical protein WR25_14691 [Diploscapter pachys]
MTELTPMVIIDIPEGAENEQPRRNRRNGITTTALVKVGVVIGISLLLFGGWEAGNKFIQGKSRSIRALEDSTTSTSRYDMRSRKGGQVTATSPEPATTSTSPETTTTSTTSTTPSRIADTTTLRESETADDDGNCDNNSDEYDEEDEDEQEEEDGDDDLATIDSDADNFDEMKEKLKKTNAGAVIKFYDSEADFKNDNAARGLLNMPIPNFCSHRKDDTFKGTIERIDKERQDAQLANAFLNNQATAETVPYPMADGRIVKQLVLHPVYEKSNSKMMKYSYGTLTYKAVLDFYHSKSQGRPIDQKTKANFEKLMKKAGCPGCDDIGHVIGYLLGGAHDVKNLFLQNAAANFNMGGFEVRQLGFLIHNEGRSIDYIVEYINGDNVNGVVRYKEIVWHLRYHAENGFSGELHFTMPNPRGVKETYFKKKQAAIASGKYAEPNLEFETYYANLPSYIMKYNVDWYEMRLNVRGDCKKNDYDTPDFEKKINRNSDGQITLHPIFSNGGKRLEYLYGQFEVKKLFDRDQTIKWRSAHSWQIVAPMKLAEKNALPGDQYGHILSACLGGSYEDVNMYPQNEEVNMDMRNFELGICNKIGKDMKNDKVTVEAMFNFTYANSGVGNVKHPRPESTNVCLRIKNEKEGKWRAICFDLPNPESVLRPYYEEFARLDQDNFFVSTIPMTKGGQDKDETFAAKYGFTIPRKGASIVDNPTNNDMICPMCRRVTFRRYENLLQHLRKHNEYRLKGLECRIPECTYRTDRKYHLQSHMKYKHGGLKSLDEIEKRECDVTRKDGEKCTFYAYTEKEINKHKEYEFYSHIAQDKGDPSQAQPSLRGAQPDQEEVFKCPITNCDKTWTIEENMGFQSLLASINCHLEKKHRKDDPYRKFQESELKQLAKEKGIKDIKGKSVELKPCEKGCLKIFRGDKGRENHYGVKKGEYYETHRKGRGDPNNPEWTEEEKEILKKRDLKPFLDNDKKGFLQVDILKKKDRSDA